MAAGRLQAVVCTSSLDLGIDWGDVDLVINVGAPKGASRLIQRIGRANHRLDEPSQAVLVPANRFEVLECQAAIEAVAAGAQDTPPLRTGAFDVLAQHVLGCACGEPFLPDELYDEVRTAAPFAGLARADFDAVVDFVATGGYALKVYERFAKIRQGKDGRFRIANPRIAQQYRLNVGTIVEETMIKVRLVRSRHGGQRPDRRDRARRPRARRARGIFHRRADAGRHLRVRRRGAALRGAGGGRGLCVARPCRRIPRCPSYAGGKFPLSTYLAARVRGLISRAAAPGRRCPPRCAIGSASSSGARACRCRASLLVETFPRADKNYLVCYPFEGRLAHQTLGMLLTRRLERARLRPLGFVANEYALAVWGLGDPALAIRNGELSLGAAVRRGHAGRRPRGLARRIGADEAHLPAMRHHLRADRAPRSRRGEERAPDDDLDRPRLRRAAPPPGRSHPAARGAPGGGRRAPRHQAARRNAGRASRDISSTRRSITCPRSPYR